MIAYITNRNSVVLCSASNDLPNGNTIIADKTSDDVETGVKTLEMSFLTSDDLRTSLEAGNFILVGGTSFRSDDYELFQIITVKNEDEVISIYGEDAGLELINRVVGAYQPTTDQTLENALISTLGSNYLGWTVNYTIPKETKKGASYFDFASDESALTRLQSILNIFEAEMFFSYSIEGLKTVARTLNIVKRRGSSEVAHVFHYGVDVERILETASIQDLATAFVLYGKDGVGNTINLSRFSDYPTYSGRIITPTDPLFTGKRTHTYIVSGDRVVLADASEKWGSILNRSGEIEQRKTTDYGSAKQLISYALTELEKVIETAFTYEVDFVTVPTGVNVGDQIRIVDDAKGQYLESRVLALSYSDTTETYEMTLGSTVRVEGRKAEAKTPIIPDAGSFIIYDVEEPPTTNRNDGDTWYKTDTDNNVVEVYTFKDEGWSKVEYTSTALNMNDVQNNIDYIGAGTGDTITLVLDGVAMRVSENIGGGEVLNIRAPITRISPKVEGESGYSFASALYVSNGGINLRVPDHTGATSNLGEITVNTNAEGSEINLQADNVLVNGQPIGGGSSSKLSSISARGTAGATTLGAGTITRVPLNTTIATTDASAFEFSSGALVCKKAGVVFISGGIYCGYNGVAVAGVYIRKNSTEISSAYGYSNNIAGKTCAPVIIEVSAGDIIELCARCSVSGGVFYPNNPATHLDVAYLSPLV